MDPYHTPPHSRTRRERERERERRLNQVDSDPQKKQEGPFREAWAVGGGGGGGAMASATRARRGGLKRMCPKPWTLNPSGLARPKP